MSVGGQCRRHTVCPVYAALHTEPFHHSVSHDSDAALPRDVSNTQKAFVQVFVAEIIAFVNIPVKQVFQLLVGGG